jgi:hypothetical protein
MRRMRAPGRAVGSWQCLIVRRIFGAEFRRVVSLLTLFFAVPAFAANCISFTDAPKKIDENVCVTGKVLKVNSSARSGTVFLNFCENYRKCPFSVVVFPRDLEKVGDVRALEGRVIEIHGRVKEYKGQAEMVLEDIQQLSGPITKLPPLPKNYDVENQGKYSAGQYGTPKKPDPGPKSKSKDKADENPESPPSAPK